ncbi:MAG: siderophore-interacting protein [Bifidobacteriaceae bacterium]|jgi:NADPH-dependent ferric siderophore reductase|nr:siderophore-interacting protein [Bifidobacteriaceae bacterium]
MAFKDARGQRGLYLATVAAAQPISPHYVRVTLRGDDLRRLPRRGYDHWFRLFLPRGPDEPDFAALPAQFGMSGYLKFKTSGLSGKVAVRNYTVREHRPEAGEIDVDFVMHGGDHGAVPQDAEASAAPAGIAASWARRAQPGDPVALIDQGCGFSPGPEAGLYVLAGDESAQPAILGILRDLPPTARGLALIEVPEPADAQEAQPPAGFDLRWIFRSESPNAPARAPNPTPGAAALAALREYQPDRPGDVTAYVCGESALAAEGRRHLVAAGVPKANIQFTGYWRARA